MEVMEPKYAITTDASPFGVGAILSLVDKERDQLTPLVTLAGKITKNVARVLGIEFRQASGQAVLEAYAVLLAIKYWKATVLEGMQLHELRAHHLPGKLNTEADFLLHPDLTGAPPGMLKDLSIRHLNEAWMLETVLPPPGTEPQL